MFYGSSDQIDRDATVPFKIRLEISFLHSRVDQFSPTVLFKIRLTQSIEVAVHLLCSLNKLEKYKGENISLRSVRGRILEAKRLQVCLDRYNNFSELLIVTNYLKYFRSAPEDSLLKAKRSARPNLNCSNYVFPRSSLSDN